MARYLARMSRVSDLGLRLSAVFRRTAPDPLVLAILLTLATFLLALTLGRFEAADGGLLSRAARLLDAWRFDETAPPAARVGLWKFLEFSMQMCLILVTGHAVAMTSPVRALIDAIASRPRSTGQAAGLIAFTACAAGLINWGLGLIVGALLAREVGRSMERRGVTAHYPLLCAAGYMGMLIWHGGLSGSAPLAMTTRQAAEKVIPAQYLAQVAAEGVPLTQTILSPMNLFITGGLLFGVPLMLSLLAPTRREDLLPISRFDVRDEPEPDDGPPQTLPDRLDRSPVISWLIALPMLLGLARWVTAEGDWRSIGLNQVNLFMLAIGLILHGSPTAYMRAATDGARGCAGIIIQFPLYAGIMGMMAASGLIGVISDLFTAIAGERTVPVLTYLSAGVVNLFVPSGGGQWGIQGPIALETGLAAGVTPGKMVMSVAYGDQLTNMLQPFWALPLLGITGVRARDIVGYTAIVMVAAGAWIALGLLVF
ncbi:MAG: short-chain fatty acid transporter [Phycisphaeraceae bacterium]|nr:MAG: short-chain fatty acid transporter [Phycisphaeraceae bacterium]